MFAFPLCENVSMQLTENTDKQKAEKFLRAAGMGNKLDKLPKGIDTQMLKVLYDDGVDLSGGEKQKMALARALYKNAPVVVLDEPTAALDALAEYRLYQSFDGMIGEKSAVYHIPQAFVDPVLRHHRDVQGRRNGGVRHSRRAAEKGRRICGDVPRAGAVLH